MVLIIGDERWRGVPPPKTEIKREVKTYTFKAGSVEELNAQIKNLISQIDGKTERLTFEFRTNTLPAGVVCKALEGGVGDLAGKIKAEIEKALDNSDPTYKWSAATSVDLVKSWYLGLGECYYRVKFDAMPLYYKATGRPYSLPAMAVIGIEAAASIILRVLTWLIPRILTILKWAVIGVLGAAAAWIALKIIEIVGEITIVVMKVVRKAAEEAEKAAETAKEAAEEIRKTVGEIGKAGGAALEAGVSWAPIIAIAAVAYLVTRGEKR